MRRPNSASMERQEKAQDLFRRASGAEDCGDFRLALELYVLAAKAGDAGSLVNIGYFYDNGIGVPADSTKALYWHTRAYRRGEAIAATNIGTIWRDKGNTRRALYWFRRAAEMGDDESNLEIAKIHIRRSEFNKAIRHLEKVRDSNRVTEAGSEEAQELLRHAQRKTALVTPATPSHRGRRQARRMSALQSPTRVN